MRTARYVDHARRALRRALAAAAPELAAVLRWRRSGPFVANRIDVDLPPGPVLVLAPHPDDEAIGVGGSIGFHLDRGSEVSVLYMTDGRGLGEVNLCEVGRKEAESVFEHHRDHLATNPLLIDALRRARLGTTMVAAYEVWDNLPFPNHVVFCLMDW